MGLCFSRKNGQSSSPTKVPPKDLPREKNSVKENKKKPELTEKKPELTAKKPAPAPVFVVSAPSVSAKKTTCVEEENAKNRVETPVKKSFQVDGERVKETSAITIHGEQLRAPLRTSSCTKEEVDAILIQCGRLSRSSSGKTSAETASNGGHKKYSGSKRSYDFDNERMGEEEQEKPVSRPSPRRRTPSRDRSGSRERRVSRSPGRRSEGSGFTTSVFDKQKQQPAKMISVPAREKGAPLVNGEPGGGASITKRVSASPRARSPANPTRISSENPHTQPLSRNSSRKAGQSPSRRNPLAEVEDNSLKTQNGSNSSMFQKSKEICSSDQKSSSHGKKTKQGVTEDPNQETETLNPITLTRTRSSRRSSRDLDNNPGFNPITSYASLLFEDIQNQQQQQHIALSLPACISKACSILDAVADLNSTCSNRRSYEAERSNNNSGKNGGFVARGLLSQREGVKGDLMESSLHRYVTVRKTGLDMEPQESAGSNSFLGHPLGSSSLWEMNSVDSTCGTSAMTGNSKEVDVEVEIEDEVGNAGNQQQQQRSWQNSVPTASGRKSPMRKKREFDQRQVQQGGGHGKVAGKAFSTATSATSATSG